VRHAAFSSPLRRNPPYAPRQVRAQEPRGPRNIGKEHSKNQAEGRRGEKEKKGRELLRRPPQNFEDFFMFLSIHARPTPS